MELTAAQAGEAIGLSHQAIRNHIHAGRLSATRRGIRGFVRVEADVLREFARAYNYTLDEEYLSRLANQETTAN